MSKENKRDEQIAANRQELRLAIDLARRRQIANETARRRSHRIDSGERKFYVCEAVAYRVAGYDYRCSKRAVRGSAFCAKHGGREEDE